MSQNLALTIALQSLLLFTKQDVRQSLNAQATRAANVGFQLQNVFE